MDTGAWSWLDIPALLPLKEEVSNSDANGTADYFYCSDMII